MRTVPAPQTLRAIAEEAARTVAPDLLAVFRAPMTISTKRDAHDVVTLHDRAAEEAITAVLTAAVPGSVVLGEEGGTTGGTGSTGAAGGIDTAGDNGDTGSTADPVVRWIVDPIDGTANFARGLAYWCISIAAEVDGEVVAGVVFDPVADHVFAADDDGAWLDGAPMHSSSGPDDAATVLTSFPVQQDLDLLGEAAAFDLLRDLTLRYRHHHSLGSGALNLVHVAAGWSDVTMGFATHPWDVAAGALVLERAGGWFRGFRRGEAVDRAHLADDYVAAGAGGSHAELVRRVQELSAATATD
ncbi:inositol monophosphatase [Curtobacterium flaccumfaciens pv. flaccumfaciens]|uniref:inositol monophosphatase family protein n=1 Tax=Curtobacterium flaccumfaciens TaxID=2035 RepID=UPI001ADCBBEE|nr:inositol monophosphatase [Curtobacterium flaccumfaciens]MBO9047421.1 inositol monophosphatase [Curtobacterium flaccumfaciens pv. flaccumfaciens]MBO9057380.1 inositol monophosphatase [Curtobacterium flaccumfaciens pv. flaccumfaciens]QTR92266.1 inositol monophosphatase [Curtobacterium flaccumfaciens pv. flaccumfaciens]QVG67565.1 inositol monophosphatase [Curtobacterium flaccumfaciens pv. flaccumfaciens]